MNGYIGFFQGKRVEIYAETQYGALVQALAHFKPRKSMRCLVSVVLAEKDGKTVTHTADN